MNSCERSIAGISSISFKLLALGELMIASVAGFQAPPVQAKYKPNIFNRQEVTIAVRDGVHLQTVIFTPKHATQTLPFLIVRTPYGVPDSEDGIVSPGN